MSSVLTLRGDSASRHPTWGSKGKPILIGDACEHADFGPGKVTAVSGHTVRFSSSAHQATHTVHVQELTREVEQVDALADADSFLARTEGVA